MNESNEITATRSRVVMSRLALNTLVGRMRGYEKLAARLREQLREENQLLMLALHQLALASGKRDPQTFSRRWLREQRRLVTGEEPPVDE